MNPQMKTPTGKNGRLTLKNPGHFTGSRPFESRKNHAACFRTKKTEDWHADFAGVVTLADGSKYWVNLYEKRDHNNALYFSVSLSPKRGK
jgi:hypothetical protein